MLARLLSNWLAWSPAMLPGPPQSYTPQFGRACPAESEAASLDDGYSSEQEALLRRSCCVLIESAGQKLQVYGDLTLLLFYRFLLSYLIYLSRRRKQLVLSTAAQYLHRYFLVKSFAGTDRMVRLHQIILRHTSCPSGDTVKKCSSFAGLECCLLAFGLH